MRKLGRYIERVSQEDAENAEMDLQKDQVAAVGAEPEALDEIEADELVTPEPAADNVRAELEEVGDIKESLEHFQVILKDAAGRGGMRPEEGAMLQASMSHFNKRLGITPKQSLGMEDFGGTMSRAKATTISQESVGETAKAAGKKIMELLAKLAQFVKEAVARFDGQAAKVGEICTKLKQNFRLFVTAQVAFESDKFTRITEKDLRRPEMLMHGNEWLHDLCKDMRAAITGLVPAYKTFAMSEGTDADLRDFQEKVNTQWGKDHPFRLAFGGVAEITLSSVAQARYKEDARGSVSVMTQRIDTVIEGEPTPVKAEFSKAEFATLLAKTEKLNDAVRKTSTEFNNIRADIAKLGQVAMTAKNNTAGMIMSGTMHYISELLDGDVYRLFEYINRSRSEVGYALMGIGKEFGGAREQDSVSVVNKR
ncbi:phiKZ-like phage internal head protein [compost metagenome]